MTLNEIEQRLDALQAEKDKLTAELERLKAEKSEVKPWRAEKELLFYYLDIDGTVCEFSDGYADEDNNMHIIGNYYRTRELAEQDAKELTLRGRVRQLRDALCEGYQYEHGKNNFYILFDGDYYTTAPASSWQIIGAVYFDTYEHAQTACDILNAEMGKESGGNG